MEDHFREAKEWYDGYHFGNADIYCPWDVMNYIRDLQINPKAKPASYWKNTSDNAIIRSFIDQFGNAIQKKLELLLSGENITQQIEEDSNKAIRQMEDRMYAKEFKEEYEEVICYGILFYKKRCFVKKK